MSQSPPIDHYPSSIFANPLSAQAVSRNPAATAMGPTLERRSAASALRILFPANPPDEKISTFRLAVEEIFKAENLNQVQEQTERLLQDAEFTLLRNPHHREAFCTKLFCLKVQNKVADFVETLDDPRYATQAQELGKSLTAPDEDCWSSQIIHAITLGKISEVIHILEQPDLTECALTFLTDLLPLVEEAVRRYPDDTPVLALKTGLLWFLGLRSQMQAVSAYLSRPDREKMAPQDWLGAFIGHIDTLPDNEHLVAASSAAKQLLIDDRTNLMGLIVKIVEYRMKGQLEKAQSSLKYALSCYPNDDFLLAVAKGSFQKPPDS